MICIIARVHLWRRETEFGGKGSLNGKVTIVTSLVAFCKLLVWILTITTGPMETTEHVYCWLHTIRYDQPMRLRNIHRQLYTYKYLRFATLI